MKSKPKVKSFRRGTTSGECPWVGHFGVLCKWIAENRNEHSHICEGC